MISIEKLTRAFFLHMKQQSVLILEDSSRAAYWFWLGTEIQTVSEKVDKTGNDKTGKFGSYDDCVV